MAIIDDIIRLIDIKHKTKVGRPWIQQHVYDIVYFT